MSTSLQFWFFQNFPPDVSGRFLATCFFLACNWSFTRSLNRIKITISFTSLPLVQDHFPLHVFWMSFSLHVTLWFPACFHGYSVLSCHVRLGTRNVHATLQLLDLAKPPHLVDSDTPLSLSPRVHLCPLFPWNPSGGGSEQSKSPLILASHGVRGHIWALGTDWIGFGGEMVKNGEGGPPSCRWVNSSSLRLDLVSFDLELQLVPHWFC